MEKITKDDGTVVSVPKRHHIYIDQIMADGTKQDVGCVSGLLDAALTSINIRFPQIQEISLQSDNTACYQSGFLVMMILFLNKTNEGAVKITELVHTETQEGKTELDGHFGQVNSILNSFLKTYNINIVASLLTPDEVSRALSTNSGMKNTIVQKLNVKRHHLEEMKQKSKKLLDKLNCYYSRKNHVYFPDIITYTGNIDDTTGAVERFSSMCGHFDVQMHSNIGRKVRFTINMTEGSVECDDIGKNHMKEWLLQYGAYHRKINDISHSCDSISSATHQVTNTHSTTNRNENSILSDDFINATTCHDDDCIITSNSLCGDDSDNREIVYLEELTGDGSENNARSDPDGDGGIEGIEIMENNTINDESIQYSENDVVVFDERCLFGPPDKIQLQNLVTGVEVEAHKPLGKVAYLVKHEDKIIRTEAGATKTKNNKGKRKREISYLEVERKDAIAVSVRIASKLLYSGGSVNILNAGDNHSMFEMARDYNMDGVKAGWATRRQGETLYGKTYMEGYHEMIDEYYLVGVRDKTAKMSAARMREKLKKDNEGRFDLPGVCAINAYISRLVSKEKGGKLVVEVVSNENDVNSEVIENKRKRWDKLNKHDNLLLERAVNEFPMEKPSKLYSIWLGYMNDSHTQSLPTYLPSRDTITKRISTLKQKIKKKSMTAVMNGPFQPNK